MTESKTVEWASVNEALEDAVDNLNVEFVDDSFSYEYGSISGTHRQMGYVLAEDVIEIDIRVPYESGWMPGEDENGVLICSKAMGEDFEISVGVEPLDLRVGLKNGFWLVRGVFSVQEID
jgi:hypothetical protein